MVNHTRVNTASLFSQVCSAPSHFGSVLSVRSSCERHTEAHTVSQERATAEISSCLPKEQKKDGLPWRIEEKSRA